MDKAKENYFTLNPDFLVSVFTDLFLSSSSSLPPPTDTEQYKYAADAQENNTCHRWSTAGHVQSLCASQPIKANEK